MYKGNVVAVMVLLLFLTLLSYTVSGVMFYDCVLHGVIVWPLVEYWEIRSVIWLSSDVW